MNIQLLFCLLLVATTAFSTKAAENESYHVLFVGNSLTYTNNLPSLVEQKARDRGLVVEADMLAFPNYAIVDHWADGQVQQLIKSGRYDYVVIQQGPSSQPNGFDMLINGGKLYRDLCQAHGVQLAYYMVWPSRQYYHTFDGVIANYTAGAAANDALLCPVGQVWKAHFDATGDFSYYGPDQFHPSLKGSLVAAEVIVDTLFQPEAPDQQMQQMWLTGVGQIENNHISVPELHVTEQGAFGAAFDPESINKVPWGALQISFDSCHTAQMSYTSHATFAGQAFGAGTYPLQRLANNVPAQQCEELGFSQAQDKSFFSGNFYGGPDRTGEGFSIDYLNSDQAIVTWYTYLPSE